MTNGLIMDYQLNVPAILRRAEQLFAHKEIVSRLPDKSFHRTTYADFVPRSRIRSRMRLGASTRAQLSRALDAHSATPAPTVLSSNSPETPIQSGKGPTAPRSQAHANLSLQRNGTRRSSFDRWTPLSKKKCDVAESRVTMARP